MATRMWVSRSTKLRSIVRRSRLIFSRMNASAGSSPPTGVSLELTGGA